MTAVPFDAGAAFLRREPITDVVFMHNDYVQVMTGPFVGSFGSLVTVECLEPEPIFVVELESGNDGRIPQSALRLVARDA